MQFRPWPIIILAWCQILTPFVNIAISAFILDWTISHYWSVFWETQNWLQILDFFGTYLILAISIFAVKKWSPPVFLTATLWNIIQTFYGKDYLKSRI